MIVVWILDIVFESWWTWPTIAPALVGIGNVLAELWIAIPYVAGAEVDLHTGHLRQLGADLTGVAQGFTVVMPAHVPC